MVIDMGNDTLREVDAVVVSLRLVCVTLVRTHWFYSRPRSYQDSMVRFEFGGKVYCSPSFDGQ